MRVQLFYEVSTEWIWTLKFLAHCRLCNYDCQVTSMIRLLNLLSVNYDGMEKSTS